MMFIVSAHFIKRKKKCMEETRVDHSKENV